MTSDTYLPPGLAAPQPWPDDLDRPFWEATRRHELLVQRCEACGRHQWGPEWICHRCRSYHLSWVPVAGRGRIYSWERVWHPVHPALTDACPYLVVLVELPDADDVRMLGNFLGDPEQEVPIGAEVEAVFEDHDGNDEDGVEPYTLVQWRLA